MAPPRIHHVNFVVRDLDAAIKRFETLFGCGTFDVIDHPGRGSVVARSRIGEAWLVLVCPYEPDSVPGRHLAAHGEGVFLLSAGAVDLDAELERLGRAGIAAQQREGIRGWRIADVCEVGNVTLQLTADRDFDD